MEFGGCLFAVKDMKRSVMFYQEVFGMEIESDFGANIAFFGGLALQTLETWTGFIEKDASHVHFQNHAVELFFETKDFDDFVKNLEGREDISYVHPVKEHSWGQRVVRIYDPDGHVIEIGENMKAVVGRFLDQGLTEKETAVRMDVSLEYILSQI